jgi:hypothetical protein
MCHHQAQGMSVNELVGRMNMSYMGIKQHCITLHRDVTGHWRRPKEWAGGDGVSPTRRAIFFGAGSHQFTLDLEIGREIYGPTRRKAPTAFSKRPRRSSEGGETRSRNAKWLAHVPRGGHWPSSSTTRTAASHSWCHSPILNLLERYPSLGGSAGHVRSCLGARAPKMIATRVYTSARFIHGVGRQFVLGLQSVRSRVCNPLSDNAEDSECNSAGPTNQRSMFLFIIDLFFRST